MALLALFGFLVGCWGTFGWITSYTELASQPAVVAVPQLILMALQALLGFLLMIVAGGGQMLLQRLARIEAILEAGAAPPHNAKTCPDCAEPVRQAARVCRFCRHEFWAEGEAPPRLPPPPPPPPPPRFTRVQTALIVFAVIIAAIVLLGLMGHRG